MRRGAGTLGGSTARRALPWTRLLSLARAAPLLKRHWDKLTPKERRRVQQLVRKSRGKPSNLTPLERVTLRRLIGKLGLRDLARDLATVASPLPSGRKRRR